MGMFERRLSQMSPSGLLVVRLLLVTDAVLVGIVGLLSLLFVERPGGLVVAGLCWVVTIGLFALVPATDPYRGQRW